jgi:phosphoribosylamine--glycine ligase
VSILAATDNGTLEDVNIEYNEGAFATVMAVSGGYPGDYKKGCAIHGIELVSQQTKTTLFQAGTGFKEDAIVTSGGRVLTITAQGNTISEAVDTAKNALGLIEFDGMNFRKDIGYEFRG